MPFRFLFLDNKKFETLGEESFNLELGFLFVVGVSAFNCIKNDLFILI